MDVVDDPVGPEELYHRLNNQLNVILAQTELLEARLTDEGQRSRAAQVVKSILETLTTARELRFHLKIGDEGTGPS